MPAAHLGQMIVQKVTIHLRLMPIPPLFLLQVQQLVTHRTQDLLPLSQADHKDRLTPMVTHLIFGQLLILHQVLMQVV